MRGGCASFIAFGRALADRHLRRPHETHVKSFDLARLRDTYIDFEEFHADWMYVVRHVDKMMFISEISATKRKQRREPMKNNVHRSYAEHLSAAATEYHEKVCFGACHRVKLGLLAS